MLSLSSIPEEHPLQVQLRNIVERLNPHVNAINALKRKILTRLVHWSENVEGVLLDADESLFVFEGIRERLQALLPDMMDAVELNQFGNVILHDRSPDETKIGDIVLPADDQWTAEYFVNTNIRTDNIERATFRPYDCMRNTDLRAATTETNGPFHLTEDEERIAKIAMTTAYVGSYAGVAQEIHMNDQFLGTLCDIKVHSNLEFAERALRWLDRNLPKGIEEDATLKIS